MIIEFGNPINLAGTSSKVRIWVDPNTNLISSIHPYTL